MTYKLLQKLVNEYGAENLRFFIPMHRVQSLGGFGLPIGIVSSDTPVERVECIIDESHYKIVENYKIELRAVNNDNPDCYYGSESYYQMDLESLIKRRPNDYQIFVLSGDPVRYQLISQ